MMKKTTKRLLSVLLSVIMAFSVFTIIPISASAAGAPQPSEGNKLVYLDVSGSGWGNKDTKDHVMLFKVDDPDSATSATTGNVTTEVVDNGVYVIIDATPNGGASRYMHVSSGGNRTDQCSATTVTDDSTTTATVGNCEKQHLFKFHTNGNGWSIEPYVTTGQYLANNDKNTANTYSQLNVTSADSAEQADKFYVWKDDDATNCVCIAWEIDDPTYVEPTEPETTDPPPVVEMVNITDYVAHWDFDDVTDNTVKSTVEGSESQYNGTLENGATVVEGSKLGGKYLHLTGGSTGSAMSVTNAQFNSQANDFSISLWIKMNSDSRMNIVQQGSLASPSNNGRTVLFYHTNSQFGTFISNKDVQSTAGSAMDNEWHQLAMTSEATDHTVTFYLDGEEIYADTAISDVNEATGLIFGTHKNKSDTVDGDMDEIYLFNRALTDSEVNALYHKNHAEVTALDGTGTKSVTVGTDPEEPAEGGVLDLLHSDEAESPVDIYLAADPDVEGLQFDGWYKDGEKIEVDGEDGKLTYDEESDVYTYKYNYSEEDIVLTANYSISSNLTQENVTLVSYDDVEENLLQKNAKASSEQYPEKDWNGSVDGYAKNAFDGDNTHWWHSRYEGSETRSENNIDGVLCDDGDNSKGNVLPGSQSVWLQTGFDDGNPDTDDSKIIAGLSFTDRTAGNGNIKHIKVWTSDHEDMNKYDAVLAFEGEFDYATPGSVEIVAFPEPVACTYVRIEVTEVWHKGNVPAGQSCGGDQHAAIDEVKIYEIAEENEGIAQSIVPSIAAQNLANYEDNIDPWQEFYTQGSIDAYKAAIDEFIADIASGDVIVDHESAKDAIAAIDEAKAGLEYSYYTVTADADASVSSFTMQPSDGVKAYQPDEDETTVYIGSNTENNLSVDVTAGESIYTIVELDFGGWKNGDEVVATDKNTTITVDGDMNLTAGYTGFNGDPSDNTATEIDNTTLSAHASANSWQASPSGGDGGYNWAFDNNPATWWHSNYGSTSEENKDGNINNTNPIWLQAKVRPDGDHQDDIMLIGGISYTGRPDAGAGRIKGYEIWVSNDEDMDANGHIVAAAGEFENNDSKQTIYFEKPVEGKYVRLVALSNHGNAQNNYIAAVEFTAFEYVGATGTHSVDVQFGGDSVTSVDIVDNNHYVLEKEVPALTQESFKEALTQQLDSINEAIKEEVGQYNSIKKNYVLDPDSLNIEDGTCELKQADAEYTVTIQTGEDDGQSVTLKAKYGEVFKYEGEDSTNKTEDGYYKAPAQEGQKFAYWQIVTDGDTEGEIVGYSEVFNYCATNNMTIKPVYVSAEEETNGDVKVFIPTPVVSVKLDEEGNDAGYLLEVPVTIHNAYIRGEDGVYAANGNIKDFGVVVVKNYRLADEEDISTLIKSVVLEDTFSTRVIKSSAYDSILDQEGLTNKGRYLHSIDLDRIESVSVYAYVIVKGDGEGADTLVLSPVKALS